MIKHEIYVSREKSGMGHNNAAALIKKAASMALEAEGVDRPITRAYAKPTATFAA